MTREVFEASKGRLRVVGRAGVGIDNVDLQAATEVRPRVAISASSYRMLTPPIGPAQLGCLVVNAPTANTIAAAEHAIALICSLARNVAQADASMKARPTPRPGPPLPLPATSPLPSHRLPPKLTAALLFFCLPQKGEWKRSKYVGASLVDKNLAIIGFGKVRSR